MRTREEERGEKQRDKRLRARKTESDKRVRARKTESEGTSDRDSENERHRVRARGTEREDR